MAGEPTGTLGDMRPPARLVIDAKPSPALRLNLLSIALNGRPISANWGQNVLTLPPGQYHVEVFMPGIVPSRLGRAHAPVWLQPGQVVELEYWAPWHAFAAGALGAGPQRRNGTASMIVMLGVIGVVLLSLVLLGFVAVLGDLA